MSWDTIMNLYVYQFQSILKSFTEILEQRQEEQKEEEKKYGIDDPSKYNPEKIMKDGIHNMPTIPTPKINFPKF